MLTLFLSVLSFLSGTARAIKLRVRDKECYYKYANEAGDKLYGSFVTQRPHFRAYYHAYIDLHIYDPLDKMIYALERRDEYKFEFDAKMKGNYKFCLSLPQHSQFNFHGQTQDNQYVELMWELHVNRVHSEGNAKEEHVDDLWTQLTKLGSDINFLKYEQVYQKARMQAATENAQKVATRMKLFAVVRSIVIVVVSIVQAFLLTKFIEQRVGAVGSLGRLGSGFPGFMGGVKPAGGSYGF